MSLLITILSIFAIALAAGLVNKIFRARLPFRICPVCAGVSGTWLAMLALRSLGYNIETEILALLMGGSVVGIAYQLDKKLGPNKSGMWWKLLFIPSGLVAALGVVELDGVIFAIGIIATAIVAAAFLIRGKSRGTETAAALEDKMKNCC